MTDVRLSVVIPTLGRRATLGRVLDRLEAQTAPSPDFEVVVAADREVERLDELDRLLEGRRYRVRRVRADLAGASAARNAGWRAADGSIVLFIDDDILPDRCLVDEHVRWHERDRSRATGVLGHVRWASELRVTPFMRWLEHGIQFNYPSIEGRETVWGNFYTANVSVKRELLERAGGFDEQRLPYGYEDLDLALRMHRADGFRLLYNRAASAEHVHAMDLEFWKQRVTRVAVSELRFVELHPEFPPYFHDLFSDAAARAPVGPGGTRLARFVPRRVPGLGRLVWSRADLYYRQSLAGPFLRAWTADDGVQSEPTSRVSSGGSPPGGPK